MRYCIGRAVNNSIPPSITSSRWGSRTKRIVVLIILIVLGFSLWNLVQILPILIGSTLISYLLWPLVNLIESRLLSVLPFRARSLAVVITFIVVIATISLAGLLIVPVLVNQLADVGDNIPIFVEAAETEIVDVLSHPLTINGQPIVLGGEPIILMERIEAITGESGGAIFDLENFDIFDILGTFLGSVSGLTGSAFSVLGEAVNAIINLSFMIVIMFYLMRDGERFTELLVKFTPESYRGDVRRLLYELGVVWNAYLRGQLVLSVTVGLAVYTAALVLGLPNAPIFGLLSGLLEFIPNIGPFISMIPAVFIALFSQSGTFSFLSGIPFALTIIIVWVAIQNIESIFLVPRVMGGRLNLHPVVVILAVIAGASIGGAIGIILAAPFMASFRVFGQYFYGKIFDTDPFPDPEPLTLDMIRPTSVRTKRLVQAVNPMRLRRKKVGEETAALSVKGKLGGRH